MSHINALYSKKVTSECEQRMVGDHLTFLHSECKQKGEMEMREDLANMYRLLKPIQGAQQVTEGVLLNSRT